MDFAVHFIPESGNSLLPVIRAYQYVRRNSRHLVLLTFFQCLLATPAWAQTENPINAAVANTPLIAQAHALPKIALTPALLEQILAAEIAAQRGYGRFAQQSYAVLAARTRDPRFAKRAAELAVRNRDGEQTLQAVLLWQELAPNNPIPAQAVLELQILLGKLQDATPALQKRIAQSQTESIAIRNKVAEETRLLLTNAPDKDTAYQLLEKLLRGQENRSAILLTLARSAAGANQRERALQLAQRALQLAPDSVEALLSVVQLSTESNTISTLLTGFIQRYPHHPDLRDVRQTLVQHYLNQKQNMLAQRELESLLQTYPNDRILLLVLARVYLQSNQIDAALPLLEQYVVTSAADKNNPTRVGRNELDRVLLTLGEIQEDKKNWASALAWYAKVESEEPRQAAISRSAQILRKTQGLAVARQYVQNLAHNMPTSSQFVVLEANLLREAKEYQAAFDLLDQALLQFNEDPDFLYEHGLAAEKIDRFDLLETQLRRVISLQPKEARAYNALGYSLADRNVRLSESLMLIEQALELQPNDPMIIDSLGWVHYRLGNHSQALEYLQRAYADLPDAEIAAHLGEVLWISNQPEAAKQVWREGMQRDPDNAVLINTLKRFGLHAQPQ